MNRSLTSFIARRLAGSVVVLLLLSFVLFVLKEFAPVDPVRAAFGPVASKEAVEAYRHQLGYDRPFMVQYFNYLGGIFHGDLGRSIGSRNNVATDIASYLPATLELVATAVVFAVIGAVVLGFTGALRPRLSGALRVLMVGGASAPAFVLALLGILLFFGTLDWLPATGRTDIIDAPTGPSGFLLFDGAVAGRFDVVKDAFLHLVMPALSLAIWPAVSVGRLLRGSLIDVMKMDYIRTARSKGLTEPRIVRRHALRNSMNGVLAILGLQVGTMFGIAVVVEPIFAWPGIGSYTKRSIASFDYPAIMGIALLVGALYITTNLIVDIVQVVLDPRIPLGA